MNDNRKLRRKNKASARSKNRKSIKSYNDSRSIYSENPIEKLNFLDHIQTNAPIDIHLSTLYSGVKIGSLDFCHYIKDVWRQHPHQLLLGKYSGGLNEPRF